jgi:Tfp pilus assembly protein PilN
LNKNRTYISAAAGILILFLALFLVSKYTKDSEKKIRKDIEIKLSAKLVEVAEAQAKIDALNQEKAVLEAEHNEKIVSIEAKIKELEESTQSLTGRIEALSKEKEALLTGNQEKEKKIADLTKKIQKMEMDRIELEGQTKTLQEATSSSDNSFGDKSNPLKTSYSQANSVAATAADLTEKPSIDPVKLGKIVVQKSSNYAARVQHVNPIYGFLVINAGMSDGIKTGTVINIIRDKRLIGRAVVEKVREKTAAAIILPEWTTEKVEAGDFISKF